MVSVPCIVDNSNGFFLFIQNLCRLVVFREHILVFFRKFWIVSVRFETVLFVLVVSIKVRNTEINRNFFFGFHETNRNKRETDLVSVCFGSNRNLFLFVSRTPYSGDIPSRGASTSLKVVGVIFYYL